MISGNWLSEWVKNELNITGEKRSKESKPTESNVRKTENGIILRRKVPGNRRSVVSTIIPNIFDQKSDDSIQFMELHPGVKLLMFPKMHEITRKDQLGENMAKMQLKFPGNARFYEVVKFGS